VELLISHQEISHARQVIESGMLVSEKQKNAKAYSELKNLALQIDQYS
jgi:hypothetical protein